MLVEAGVLSIVRLIPTNEVGLIQVFRTMLVAYAIALFSQTVGHLIWRRLAVRLILGTTVCGTVSTVVWRRVLQSREASVFNRPSEFTFWESLVGSLSAFAIFCVLVEATLYLVDRICGGDRSLK